MPAGTSESAAVTAGLRAVAESAAAAGARRRLGKVLLLDGYSTRTLACVRSWGKRGIDFAVGGERRTDMSLFSRYATEKCVYTSPRQDVRQFIRDVNQLCRRLGAEHVFPTSEVAIMACSEQSSEMEAAPIVPRREDIEASFSKANTLRAAALAGVAVPETACLTREHQEIPQSIIRRFPVVVKPESSEVTGEGRTTAAGKTYYAANADDLRRECRSRLERAPSVLLQEFIDGYGVGVSGLFDKGRPIALLAHRRIRESNPLGGPSALAETIALEPELLDSTTRLMAAIGFTGPAMVEFKVDRRDGRAVLMEINGRFWGSLPLAPAAGLDLPYLYWKMLSGENIADEEKQYKIGIRGRNLVGDTKCLLSCMKGVPAGWPGAFPSRGDAVRDYLASFFDPNTFDMIFSAEDPLPFAARLLRPHS